jgi:hypothetical protein
MMNCRILSAISISFLCAGAVAASSLDKEFIPVKAGQVEGVIVPDSRGPDFYKIVTAAGGARIAEMYWTPAAEDVLKAEEALVAHLKEARPRSSPDLWQKLPQYYRQYVGLGCSCKGDKRVWINFIDKSHAEKMGLDWKRSSVRGPARGEGSFDITYEMRTGLFRDLCIDSR